MSDLKNRIITESLKLFTLKGFLSTSMNHILEAAGTSKGGFYNHFKSKEDLFSAVLKEARQSWRDKNLVGLSEIQKPVEKIKKLLKNYKDLYLKDTESFPGGCIFVTLSVELDDQRPHLAKELNLGFVRLKAMINRLLVQGKTSGEIRGEVDTEAVAEMIFAGMIGASVLFSMNKSFEDLDQSINPLITYLERLS